MRLNDLFEDDIPAKGDIIEVEFGDLIVEGIFQDIDEDGEMAVWFDDQGDDYITELVPLIPAAIAAGGAAWSAYDAYQAKKSYDRGEISKAQLATQIGTDAAIAIAGGGVAKLASKGVKAVKTGINKLRNKNMPNTKKPDVPAKKTRRSGFNYDSPNQFGKDNAFQRAVATATAVENISNSLDEAGNTGMYRDEENNTDVKWQKLHNGSNSYFDIEAYRDGERVQINNQQADRYIYLIKQEIDESVNEAEYQGRKVKLGKPTRGDVKKFKVYVKNPKGNVVKVNFGHGGTSAKRKTMRIKKSNPARRKSFRARHNCDSPGPRHKARYWSCRAW